MGAHGVGWSGVCRWQPLSHAGGKTLLSHTGLGTWAGCPIAPPGLGQMMPKSKEAPAR